MSQQPPQLPDPPDDLFDGFVASKPDAKAKAVAKLQDYIQRVSLGIIATANTNAVALVAASKSR